MSIDVFGRKLDKVKKDSPGIGYKITKDGHYDVDYKRICNLADPQQENDVVNLRTLRKTSEADVKALVSIISSIQTSIDYVQVELKKQKGEILKLKNYKS